jgi:hypothetical protein
MENSIVGLYEVLPKTSFWNRHRANATLESQPSLTDCWEAAMGFPIQEQMPEVRGQLGLTSIKVHYLLPAGHLQCS